MRMMTPLACAIDAAPVQGFAGGESDTAGTPDCFLKDGDAITVAVEGDGAITKTVRAEA
ncbi:hypothetical protein [Arthrobacter sp.]|uniref:hypothetical protein n=1 Tax=Arthrobacter sp. TaxID=1667 RepID=UPI00339A311A